MRTKVYNNPMRDFVTFANAMNRAFGADLGNYDYVRNGGHNGEAKAETAKMRLPVDVWTENDAFVITAYLPGVDPEAVEITMEGEELAIRGTFPALPQPEFTPTEGEAAEAPENKGPEFIKRELYRGAFERRMTINVPVDVENIEATYEHGVLTLRVPKAEAVRPKQIKVVAK
ncbi:MAG: Hsp20/alpha crystallin family protein [Caldilineaceae bacterium]